MTLEVVLQFIMIGIIVHFTTKVMAQLYDWLKKLITTGEICQKHIS